MYRDTVGVIIGRFQVPELHPAHLALIRAVATRHRHVLILVGCTGGQPTSRDPLDYQTRRHLFGEVGPAYVSRLSIAPLFDCADDQTWAANVDRLIGTLCPAMNAVIYGGRESCVPTYANTGGGWPCEHIPINQSSPAHSGASLRAKCAQSPEQWTSRAFREGVIYGASRRFPTSYQAVDIAIRRSGELLMASKADESGVRFIGGFVDPADVSLEAAASREAHEETGHGLELSAPRYVMSARIPDHRYRQAEDQVMSALFVADYVFGCPVASDDIIGLEWLSYEAAVAQIVPAHRPFLTRLLSDDIAPV